MKLIAAELYPDDVSELDTVAKADVGLHEAMSGDVVINSNGDMFKVVE